MLTKNRKAVYIIIILLNAAAVVYLVCCAVPFLLNDTTVQNPNSSFPLMRCHLGGICLLLGILPMAVVNGLTCFTVAKDRKMRIRLLCFLPMLLDIVLGTFFLICSLPLFSIVAEMKISGF